MKFLTGSNLCPVDNFLSKNKGQPFASFAKGCPLFIFAAGLGLEPRYIDPESMVLPLDDPANNLPKFFKECLGDFLRFAGLGV